MKLVCVSIVASVAVMQVAAHVFAVSTSAVDVTASTTVTDFKVHVGGGIIRNDNDEDFGPSGGHVTATANASNTFGDSSATAEAKANAQIGHLGVSVLGSVAGAPRNRPDFCCLGGKATSSTSATAEWLDTVTIKSRSRIALRAVFNVFLDGDVDAFGSSASAASASVSIANPANSTLIFPGNTDILRGGVASHSPLGDNREEVIGAFRVELFPPEGPFPIGLRLIATGAADSNPSLNEANWDSDAAAYSGELSRSLTWGGLEGVYDFFTGEELDDWTITSESGFDYSQPFPVPEPSSIAIVIGASCFWLRRRRA